MADLTFLGSIAALLKAALIAAAILWLSLRFQGRAPVPNAKDSLAKSEFHMCDEKIIGKACAFEPFPFGPARPAGDWTTLRHWLEPRFGALPLRFEEIAPGETVRRPATDQADPGILTLTRTKTTQRVTLIDRHNNEATALHHARMRDETLATCLAVLNNAPCAMRCEHLITGQTWKNAGFASFSESEEALFVAAAQSPTKNRVRLTCAETGEERCFHVTKATDAHIETLYLLDVTEVAQAEKIRREFIQTLTKTFANLTTGLAVFDRHKNLALFNPALMDLTNLPAVFLSSRPTMTQFFDRLRNNKVLPEPKNYGTWRNQIDEMIRSASDGLYFEDWSLPNGETYRVAGRPHPDGAVAFLFEDISDEIALTRRFRSQIDIRQAALDTCQQAITIIGPSNVVLLCNKPASSMLGIDPDSSFADMSIHDFMQACLERLPHDRFWTLAEAKILARDPSEGVIHDIAGQPHRCTIRPIRGNSVLISIAEDRDLATPRSQATALSA